MDTTAVTMDQAEAARAFREYRAAFMAERNRIDGELMRGYKALAAGKTLISLTEAIQKGGVDEMGRPRIAIARADEEQIDMRRTRFGGITYQPDRWRRIRNLDRRFDFPDETLPALTPEQEAHKIRPTWGGSDSAWTQNWIARTPFIPPQYRPPHALLNYHLLWEAEWRLQPRAQRLDPMLLKRIGGDLFAVVAAWDLTPIEKLVLAR